MTIPPAVFVPAAQVCFELAGLTALLLKLFDSNLNGESFYELNDREILNIANVYGARFSAYGSPILQPSTNGIDVLDGILGNLRNRISLPVPLSPDFDALVDDGADNTLVAITGTGNGVAIVDLTAVSESSTSVSQTHRWMA